MRLRRRSALAFPTLHPRPSAAPAPQPAHDRVSGSAPAPRSERVASRRMTVLGGTLVGTLGGPTTLQAELGVLRGSRAGTRGTACRSLPVSRMGQTGGESLVWGREGSWMVRNDWVLDSIRPCEVAAFGLLAFRPTEFSNLVLVAETVSHAARSRRFWGWVTSEIRSLMPSFRRCDLARQAGGGRLGRITPP